LTRPLRIQSERVFASQREVSDYPATPRTGRTNQRHHKRIANTSLADFNDNGTAAYLTAEGEGMKLA
jgi:hypothetical protein